MTISPGARLGPYTILAPLGAGAMGEVYRARDPRLGRDVAIKVLPPTFASDPDRLRRFQQEARAVAALNHPNIIAVYDVGADGGHPFLITELLEGETLRSRLLAPLPLRLALDFAVQIARGLAAAHDKGIIHRDLKPENLFVAKDRRVKILDFGLAKQTGPDSAITPTASTMAAAVTEPGLVLGTVGYMAPEQVRGLPADHRADLFAFGAILYEMVSGRRAFHAPTSAETMAAILNSDPPPISSNDREIPPALDRIVRHCLEKDPKERYQSAHDLAFQLQALLDPTEAGAGRARPTTALGRINRWLVPATLVIGLGSGLLVGRPIWTGGGAVPPSFHRVTFRSGFVWSARFAPDGRTIVYSASWGGSPLEVFSTRPESPESRSLDLSNSNILSISQSGEMAVLLHAEYAGGWAYRGTLARLPLEGGAPREILTGVLWADWAPREGDLAVVREFGGKRRLEYPIGTRLYETAGTLREPRFSPSGDRIAFLDHPIFGDDRGIVAMVDRAGKVARLTGLWKSIQGLAWSPSGNEIWFTAAEEGPIRALYAVSRSGHLRTILRQPGSLAIQDISRDGHVLLADWTMRYGIAGRRASDPGERDLSWLDWSAVRDLSSDGQSLLFTEGGEGGGASYGVYLRKTDGSPAVRLGEGEAMALSPDAKWVLSVQHGDKPRPILLPTGAGQARMLPQGRIREYQDGSWMPDGERVLLLGSEQGHASRFYIQSIAGGDPSPITPEGVTGFGFGAHTISPDGKLLAGKGPDGQISLWPLGPGVRRPVPGLLDGEFPIRWSADGRSLFAALPAPGRRSLELSKIDLQTGRRTLWKRLVPADAVGVTRVGSPLVSADGSTYAYTYGSHNSNLYLVKGLR